MAAAAAAAVCLVPRYVRYPYVLEKIAFLSRSLESCCCIHSFLVSGSTSCIRLTRGGPGSRSCSLSDQGKSDSITSGLVAFGFMSSAGKCYLSLISPPILNFDVHYMYMYLAGTSTRSTQGEEGCSEDEVNITCDDQKSSFPPSLFIPFVRPFARFPDVDRS